MLFTKIRIKKQICDEFQPMKIKPLLVISITQESIYKIYEEEMKLHSKDCGFLPLFSTWAQVYFAILCQKMLLIFITKYNIPEG